MTSEEEKELEEEIFDVVDASGRVVELPIPYIVSGTVWVVRGGRRMPLLHSKRKSFNLQSGDRLITGNGFIMSMGDSTTKDGKTSERTRFIMFPDSELVLSAETFEKENEKVTAHAITRMELAKGLFWVSVSTVGDMKERIAFPSDCPQLEFKAQHGEWGRRKEMSAAIEVSNGTVTIFRMNDRVVHKGLGLEARIGTPAIANGKITATRSALYATNLGEYPDERVKLVCRTIDMLSNSSIKGSDEESERIMLPSYTPVAETDRIVERKASRSMKNLDQQTDEFWTQARKMEDDVRVKIAKFAKDLKEKEGYDYAPQATKDRIDEEIKQKGYEIYDEYSHAEKRLREGSLNKELDLIAAGKKGLTATTATAPIGKTFVCGDMSFDLTTAEKGIEIGMRKAKPGKAFLLIRFRAVNNATKPIFLSPDEEFRLFAGSEAIPLDNYFLETNPDPGKTYEGRFQFIVPETVRSFILEFGKKKDKKVQINISA